MGTRISRCDYCPLCWDHPHACGDKFVPLGQLSHFAGSSPRVWGQDANTIRSIGNVRIIPTRVETRIPTSAVYSGTKDHPHACGDKLLIEPFRALWIGSSPRVWGQVVDTLPEDLMFGIIPTRVGTSKR